MKALVYGVIDKVESRLQAAKQFGAHDDFEQAYRVFGDAADSGALKVVLSHRSAP